MAKVKDLTGRRFGRLVVLNEEGRNSWGEAMWHCHCDCGNEIITAGRYLRNGDTRSCGCLKAEREILKPEDLSGQRFGRLIAVSYESGKWLCVCDCGNTCRVAPDKLKSGHTQSCGCFQREQASKAEVRERWNGTNIALLRSKKAHSNTGVKGVSRIAKTGLYNVEIFAQGVRTYIGKFHTLEAAIKARKRAEEELHQPLIEEYEEEEVGQCAETKAGAQPEEPAGRKQT